MSTLSTSVVENKIPFWLIIPAAGIGTRVGSDLPKQYCVINGKTVLEHTIEVFINIAQLKGVVVALHAEDKFFSTLSIAKHPLVKTVVGGKERADSVLNALQSLADKNDDWVLVHDAARPCVQAQDVVAMLKTLGASDVGGIMAVAVGDTIKSVNPQNEIVKTEDRRSLWQAQTPQMFRLQLLRSALLSAREKNAVITDEASAMELLGYKPQVFPGKRSNLKITVPEDLAMAASLLKENSMNVQTGLSRIGHGFDVHRFAEQSADAFVVLGGVKIPHKKKLIAHSDGDVLIHALCDALLGAAALGDIGKHFPDTDNAYKNIDSRQLLKKVAELLQEKHYVISNIDVTVVAQAPKVLPHVESIRSNLASDLCIDVDRVNVKATTTEGLGFEGREEGISCHAVALIYKK